jgi:hypothetical protein
MTCEENCKSVEGEMKTEKDKNGTMYIFHMHLDARIYREARVFDHSHPPGLCVCEEGRGLFELRLLTAPFQKRLDDVVV